MQDQAVGRIHFAQALEGEVGTATQTVFRDAVATAVCHFGEATASHREMQTHDEDRGTKALEPKSQADFVTETLVSQHTDLKRLCSCRRERESSLQTRITWITRIFRQQNTRTISSQSWAC